MLASRIAFSMGARYTMPPMGMAANRAESATDEADCAVVRCAALTLTTPVRATVTSEALVTVGTTHCGRRAST